MDALPIKEQIDSPHASTVTMKNWSGEVVSVMHACGHDVHMTALIGAAELLAKAKDRWRGTLILIAQPFEEGFSGAKLMVDAGLFDKVPKPNYCLGIHVDAQLSAGDIGITVGPASANSNAVDITVYGRGGHGSQPHRTIDPIVIGARIVTTLQTIVSREVDPLDSAVVTVGSFHAGTKRNIIPDEAKLALTVRTYKPATRVRVLEAISRIAKAEAAAAGAVEPLVDLSEGGYDMVTNDPALCERLGGALKKSGGAEHVHKTEPMMGSEDFGSLRHRARTSSQFRIGANPPPRLRDAVPWPPAAPQYTSARFPLDVSRRFDRRPDVCHFGAGVAREAGGGGGPYAREIDRPLREASTRDSAIRWGKLGPPPVNRQQP